MAQSSSDVAARVSELYKGIEGFYVLNAQGELGYFSDDGARLIKESFEADSPAAGDSNAGPAGKIELFRDELKQASESFPPGEDKELGYLMPVDEARVWNTATLVLHDEITKELKDAFDRDIKKGLMTLAEGDRKASDIATERGLHRGFEDLLNHVGTFGNHTFFPVLYFRPATGEDKPAHPLRVLNLMWLISGTGRFSNLLGQMRRNLAERGALNQESRVEHRFKLLGEED